MATEDKYRQKGSQTRSRFLSRSKNRAITNAAPTGMSEQQKREITKEAYRANPENKGQISNLNVATKNIGLNILNNLTIASTSFVNTLVSLTSLQKGDSLKSLILHNYNGGSAALTMSVYWSYGDQTNLTPTISSGVVTASKGAVLTALFSASIPYLASVDLSEMLSAPFHDVSKDVYFYVVASNTGPTITYSTTSG
tara:strand:+ start:77 stop:667 length:591 start_codon:yes stop_codon:yes gene_type:complete